MSDDHDEDDPISLAQVRVRLASQEMDDAIRYLGGISPARKNDTIATIARKALEVFRELKRLDEARDKTIQSLRDQNAHLQRVIDEGWNRPDATNPNKDLKG